MEIAGFLLAALVGITLGLIGGGGSILTVPILVYVMRLDPILATSYSLFIVGITSLVGSVYNFRRGFINVRIALLFGLSSITTVFITRKILIRRIPEVIYQSGNIQITHSMLTMLLFALLMLAASYAMIMGKKVNITPPKPPASDGSDIVKLLLYGVLIGLATGFLGAGGGFLLIPALVLILKMPMKMAIGTSLLIIALNSLIGFTGDIGHVAIHWTFLITITSVAVAGIFIGGAISKKTEGEKLKKGFGWFVLLMGIFIIVKETFWQ